MQRKIINRLLKWKTESNGRTAVLLQGARRVGKSYAAEAFAKEHYRSYILIDFNIAEEMVRNLFIHDITDPDMFFQKLSAYYNTRLYERESLIIFDEVQLFPRARSVIKYLVADGRFDYIETGSLISIKQNVSDILLPSEEEHINVYPMDFEEFLWALEDDTMMPYIENCFAKRQPLGQELHRKAMNYFRQYLIVGGMPQAVDAYRTTRAFDMVDAEKRRILHLYRDDIQKYAARDALKAEAVFDELPSQLRNQNRHFKLSSIKEGARFDDFKDAFFWLSDAMIVNFCYNSTEPNLGLRLNQDRTLLKCYMGDTGLLVSHAFDENGIVSENVYRKLLLDKLEVNMGMIVENAVSQMLTATDHKLYFYANADRNNKENRMEIDFLLAKTTITNRHNISPIEVKSGKNYTLSSLRKFQTKYAAQTHTPYVLHPSDLKEEAGILFLPLYMTPLL